MYLCVCVYFSGLLQVRKPMENVAFPEHFNYKAPFPFSTTELTRTSVTEKRADKGLESPSPIRTHARNPDQFCSEYLLLAVEPRCVMITWFQLVTHR